MSECFFSLSVILEHFGPPWDGGREWGEEERAKGGGRNGGMMAKEGLAVGIPSVNVSHKFVQSQSPIQKHFVACHLDIGTKPALLYSFHH